MAAIVHGAFEWDKAKNESNIKKHAVDFVDAAIIFEGVVFETPAADHHREARTLAIGRLYHMEVVASVHLATGTTTHYFNQESKGL